MLGPRAEGHRDHEDHDARDTEGGRVVLRFIREAGTTPGDLTRVRREAKALAALAHPNIVSAHGLGMHDGRLFIVMKAIAATSLDHYIATHSPSWRAIVERFIEAGRGLAAAHARAVVHRAIRPRAIVVDEHGRGLLGDFSLGFSSWPAGSPREASMDGLRVMAPEHLRGRPATIYSDQFAFCAALWQAVTGEHPLGAADDREALLDALSRDDAPSPPGFHAPRRLWRALAPGLARDPASRYGSMHELVHALEQSIRSMWRTIWPGRT